MSLNDKLQSFVASVFGVHKAGYNHTTEDQLWDMLRDHIDQQAEQIERLKKDLGEVLFLTQVQHIRKKYYWCDGKLLAATPQKGQDND